MQKIKFGTDGVRGKVGEHPMTVEAVMKLGHAAGSVLVKHHGLGCKVLIGKDTRVSGYMIESALQAGLSAAGVAVRLLGPLPTPGIAYLTRTYRSVAGIVISASHNPYFDNGIKFFGEDGRKLSAELESEISAACSLELQTVPSNALGMNKRLVDAAGRYIEFCKSTFDHDLNLRGLKVVVDAANGAAYQVAPKVFRELGADMQAIGIEPNGFNINDGVGSTAPQMLQQEVLEQKADIGIALDGDADRLQIVSATGELVDGDQLLYLMAKARKEAGTLVGPVVGTVMSNLGLEKAIQDLGVEFIRAPVGDKHVMAELAKSGGVVGGESSGHLLCLDKTTTGDGIVAALDVLEIMLQSGRNLDDLLVGMKMYPQRTINVGREREVDVESDAEIQAAKSAAEQALDGSGRVILRASGTQPLVRVTVEADSQSNVDQHVETLAAVVEKRIAA